MRFELRSTSKPAGGTLNSRLIAHSDDGSFLPIWSCSVWGLPCPRHYCRGGALLPHLFTLTPASLQGLCHPGQSEGSGCATRTVRVSLRTNQSRAWHASSQSPYNDAEAVYFLWHFPSTGLEPGVPDVIRHTALRSSDFPLPPPKKRKRPSGPAAYGTIICDLEANLAYRISDLGPQAPNSVLSLPAAHRAGADNPL